MSNEEAMQKTQSATEVVLDAIQKKLLLLKAVIGKLEERLSVVLLPDDKKEPPVPVVETEGMSLLKQRLTAHVYDIDQAIEKVERIINLVEV